MRKGEEIRKAARAYAMAKSNRMNAKVAQHTTAMPIIINLVIATMVSPPFFVVACY